MKRPGQIDERTWLFLTTTERQMLRNIARAGRPMSLRLTAVKHLGGPVSVVSPADQENQK